MPGSLLRLEIRKLGGVGPELDFGSGNLHQLVRTRTLRIPSAGGSDPVHVARYADAVGDFLAQALNDRRRRAQGRPDRKRIPDVEIGDADLGGSRHTLREET